MSAERLSDILGDPLSYDAELFIRGERIPLNPENVVVYEHENPIYDHCVVMLEDGDSIFYGPGLQDIRAMKTDGFPVKFEESPSLTTLDHYYRRMQTPWPQAS